MNKARKKFVVLSELSDILLLIVLLATINIISFAQAAEEADMMTDRIAGMNGSLDTGGKMQQRMDMPNDIVQNPGGDQQAQLPKTYRSG